MALDTVAFTSAPEQSLFTEWVTPALEKWQRAGLGVALVTLVGVEGSSPRFPGSQMAVNENGEYCGFISSGCAEAAIVAEAVASIAASSSRTVRYGAGSKYIDVVLPCGSGIDVHFEPNPAPALIADLNRAIESRQKTSLTLEIERGGKPAKFVRVYAPEPRLLIAGRGVNVDFLARFARDLGWEVALATPDEETLSRVSPIVAHVQHLTSPKDFKTGLIDSNTAVVLMFHDHEWEPPILAACQDTPAFYIGALGSRRTHAQRSEILTMLDCRPDFIDRIRSPVGLNIGARNPPQIALAVMAEILESATSRH